MAVRNVTRATKPREETARKRREILRAATEVFGSKGYTKGSLADIARNASKADSGEVLQEVSAVSISASNVG